MTRWLVQARAREPNVTIDYRGVRRRTVRWSSWQTVGRFETEAEALAASRKPVGLCQLRVTHCGRVVACR